MFAATGHLISDDNLALQILNRLGIEYDVVVNLTNRPDNQSISLFKLKRLEFKVSSQSRFLQHTLHFKEEVIKPIFMVEEVTILIVVVEVGLEEEKPESSVNSMANKAT